MNKQPEVLNKIAAHLASFPHVQKVVLYGSRARGDEAERSDIDLAVVGPDLTSKEWLEMQQYVEEDAPTLLFIDLLRFEDAPEDLKDSINREGVTLYERK